MDLVVEERGSMGSEEGGFCLGGDCRSIVGKMEIRADLTKGRRVGDSGLLAVSATTLPPSRGETCQNTMLADNVIEAPEVCVR